MMPFGDRALRFAIPRAAPRRQLLDALRKLAGVVDVVFAETIGCLVYADEADPVRIERDLADLLHRADEMVEDPSIVATHVIRVIYDGEDLETVAERIGRSPADVIALHAGRDYRVAMLGFLPGFAYLRGLPDELKLPRRAPRPRVRAGSVAIGADYTGVYPFACPGGWHLLGHAVGFEPFGAASGLSPGASRDRATLSLGDVVRFTPETTAVASRSTSAIPLRGASIPPRPHLEIVRAAGLALFVDGGRPGRMDEGVPPGGPLVRSLFMQANSLAGNVETACSIELAGSLEVVCRGGAVVVADDTQRVTLTDGEHHVLSTERRVRVRYLAVAGGIDAPVVLGSRGALLVAGLGKPLRRGDLLFPQERGGPGPSAGGRESFEARESGMNADMSAPIAIAEGPDAAAVSLDLLTTRELRVAAASDRMGTRLEGPLESFTNSVLSRPSAPMVLGAIELTPSGLVVFGPDHPTTGGYPVIAIVRSGSLDAFFSRPIGAPVRFAPS